MFSTRMTVIGTLGALGLCTLFLRSRPAALPHTTALSTAPPPRSAAEVALRRAREFRTRAKIAVSEQRSGLEAWDPQGSRELDPEAWRLQQLAFDRDGNLRQARQWAREAASLARTRSEKYQATELLVLLDHETGSHEAEFREAQRLIVLAPASLRAQMVLRRAANCYRMRVKARNARGGTERDLAPPSSRARTAY